MSNLLKKKIARSKHTLILHDRDIIPPAFGEVDFDESFTGDQTVKCLVSTKRGTTLFDGVSTDKPITHKFTIDYIAGVTAETWITFKGRKFDILDVENCCEEDQFLVLRSAERGTAKAAEL